MMMVTLGDDQATHDVARVAYTHAEDATRRKVACSIGSLLQTIARVPLSPVIIRIVDI